MPSYLPPRNRTSSHDARPEDIFPDEIEDTSRVFITSNAEETVAGLHRAVTDQSRDIGFSHIDESFQDFQTYLKDEAQKSGPRRAPLSVCFKSVTTYGQRGGSVRVKTLKDAIWRTLTFQDIFEWTLKPLLRPQRLEDAQPLIRDFSGVVKTGQMMLVLGNPGSGCSTFLRTITNEHSTFLGVKGSIDYSGLSSEQVSTRFRGSIAYIPEEDVHLPTLTVRQTLEFALRNKTPKRWLHEVPRFLDEFGRIFGMTHVMDTLVGNAYIRGVSGGERKRVSILESLAADSSINAWDGSTRGLDASSALDFIRSLRIMTDACERATIVSIYQASDAIYHLMDKVMLVDEGRMLYQGAATEAEGYFGNLGFKRLERQTMSDFLTSIASGNPLNIKKGWEDCAPRGSENLENIFKTSSAYKAIELDIQEYEAQHKPSNNSTSSGSSSKNSDYGPKAAFEKEIKERKSRFVSEGSAYNTSLIRQILLCTVREFWQLKGHLTPHVFKFFCVTVSAFLLGSMFYQMPDDTDGVYSRGGLSFYSAIIIAWFQLSELETAFYDREVTSRQKRYAMVRPSAVVVAKTLVDLLLVFMQSSIYSVVAYFLAGLRPEAGAFFAFDLAIILCGMAFTAMYRVFGAASPRLEVALRYSGVLLLAAMVCGGYVRSVEKLMSDAPWVGWLAYLTPVLYAFEIIMAFEFHGRSFPCTPGSLIPSGPNYGNTRYQSCASVGVAPGELIVNGDTYLKNEFGFSYGNVGRNFGILIAFIVGFLLINAWLVEKVDWVTGGVSSPEYTQLNPQTRQSANNDEESKVAIGENRNTPDATQQQLTTTQLAESGGQIERTSSTFTWRDIHYTVPHKDGDKLLLDGVTGFCEPGKLTALVGASGAGKSTLMTVLTQQGTGKVAGDMHVDGKPIESNFARNIGYCQQMDIHVETSTVREAFEFSALLRQSSSYSKEEKLAYVDTVLQILNMTEIQHALIRSLSLEQKKRTTIGVELCARPSLLLFLDEPTSGLDSQGAISIVRLLRQLADSGLAIICTIHQASQEQFELFDRVLALNRGGSVYYFGDIGERGRTVLEYFTRHGIEAEPDKNVADLLIEVTSWHSASQKHAQDWDQIWRTSPEALAVLQKIDAIQASAASKAVKSTTTPSPAQETKQFASPTLQQTLLLTKRTTLQYWRTPDYIYSRLYCSFMHSTLIGLAFLQLTNSVAALQHHIFALFLVLMIVPEFINACSMMFIENRNVWLSREAPSRVYGWVAFTSAQVLAEIPYALLGGLVYYVLLYFLVGLPLGAPAGYTLLMMIMFHAFSTSWGQWIAALSVDAVMAASVMPFFIIMCELFNGVLQPRSLMPSVWAYTMYYIAPFTYWISGIVAIIFPGLVVQCTPDELTVFDTPGNLTCGEYANAWLETTKGYLVDAEAVERCGYCLYAGGDDYLSNISVSAADAWPYLCIFLLFTVSNYASVYFWVYVYSVRRWLPW